MAGPALPKEAGDPERGTGPDGPALVGQQGSPDSEPISVEMEGKSEDALAAEVVDSAIQHVVGDGGQRVITIVTDQHGNLQPAGLSQQFFVTMQGQQMVAVPANAITEEVVEEEFQQAPPPRKRKADPSTNHSSLKEKKSVDSSSSGSSSREQLQRQLHEANRKAQEYRQQLEQKEQEAEQYRLRLEQAMAGTTAAANNHDHHHDGAGDFVAVETVAVVTEEEEEEEEREEVVVQLEVSEGAMGKEDNVVEEVTVKDEEDDGEPVGGGGEEEAVVVEEEEAVEEEEVESVDHLGEDNIQEGDEREVEVIMEESSPPKRGRGLGSTDLTRFCSTDVLIKTSGTELVSMWRERGRAFLWFQLWRTRILGPFSGTPGTRGPLEPTVPVGSRGPRVPGVALCEHRYPVRGCFSGTRILKTLGTATEPDLGLWAMS
ncbi:unnamed protein product [Merluccius merluccius]